MSNRTDGSFLLVIRHAQSEANVAGRVSGWSAGGLSEMGRRQLDASANVFAEVTDGSIFTSDVARARQTADYLGKRLGREVVLVSGLRAHDLGAWDGLTWTEIEQSVPDARRLWLSERLLSAPGGEVRDAFVARVLKAAGHIAAVRSSTQPLIVAHGGVVRVLERHIGLPVSENAWTPHLSGRWFCQDGDEWSGGSSFSPS